MAYQGGGRTDKAGNKYEINYFIYTLLKVVKEEIKDTMLEALGEDEIGTDIWITNKDESREAMQCKGRNGNKDKWSLESLNSYNIFDKWKMQLDRNSQASVSIVSPISFILLEDLIIKARTSGDNIKDFYNNQILKNSDKEMRKFYKKYCELMKLDLKNEGDIIKSVDYLKRTNYHQVPDNELKNLVIDNIKLLFNNDSENVYETLLNLVINEKIWAKKIDAYFLKKYIEEKGLTYRNLACDKRILPRINLLNKEYNSFFIPINTNLIMREEYFKCQKYIDDGESVIIHGKAGYGKSGITQIIINNCIENEIPYIAIKLDKRIPRGNAEMFGKYLGLPASISYCLDSINKNKNAVIILDQLDALRWTQADSRDSLIVCRELIDEIKNINRSRERKISIVLVCRSYDLNYDNNIRSLFELEEKWNEIQVDKFSDQVVKSIIGKYYQNNSSKLNELLKIPSNLFIWTQLDKDKKYDNCYTTNKLLEEWWNQLLIKANILGIENKTINECIDEMVKQMYNNSRLFIIRKAINCDIKALNYLSSNGFIFVNDKQISFTHQRILDYFLEVEMVKKYSEGKSIEEIIGTIPKQIPSRRYQVQMFLDDLSEIDLNYLVNVGKSMLNSSNVRFFIKHVFFEVLGQLEEINEEVENFILEYINNKNYYKYIINNVIRSHFQYVKLLLKKNVLDDWFEKGKKDLCISLISSVKDRLDIDFVGFIKRHLFKYEEDDKKLYRCFSFEIARDTDEMFKLRMDIYKKYPEFSEEYINFKELLEKNEIRAIVLIKFLLENKIKNKKIYKYEELILEESEIIIQKGEEILELLLPIVPKDKSIYYGDWMKENTQELGIERATIDIIKKANKNLINNNPKKFWEIYNEYMGKGYQLFNEIILDGLLNFPEEYSDDIIAYLCEDIEKNMFEHTSGSKDELLLTKEILKKYSKSCSNEKFELIKNKISYYVENDSKELYRKIRKYNMNYQCNKMPWDWWGNLQVELLPNLDQKRLDYKTKRLIDVLNRRFEDGSIKYKYSQGHFGSVYSPLDNKKLSNKQWIKILSNEKIRNKYSHDWKETKKGFVESSIREFSMSFSNEVSREPKRMVKLVLENSNIILSEYIDALYSGLRLSDKIDQFECYELERLFKKFPPDYESYIALNICNIIEKIDYGDWSYETLEIIKNIAEKHKDPVLDKTNGADEKDIIDVENLQIHALNCTRGSALRTIGHLLWLNDKLFDFYKSTIEKLVDDENIAVRYASFYCLMPIYNIDKNWATEKILKMFEKDIRNVTFWRVRSILFKEYSNEKSRILNIIRDAFKSNDEKVRECGAYCITEMYILHDEFRDIFDSCEKIEVKQQNAILRMINNYFNLSEYNNRCKEIVMKLKNAGCNLEAFIQRLFYDKCVNIERDKEFIKDIIGCYSGKKIIHAFVSYIEKNALSIIEYADIILELLNSIANSENSEEYYYYSNEITKLLVGLYDETKGKTQPELVKINNECLNIWDKMLEKQIGMISDLSKELSDR